MTSHRNKRYLGIATGLVALVAPLAAVTVASAPAAQASNLKSHHVKLYKVEAQVDLDGEFPGNTIHQDLSCNPGDDALDGMWRVDHVDQANTDVNPDATGDARDVVVTASYGDPGDMGHWNFDITNNATGSAQLKVFITCISSSTENQHGHNHAIIVEDQAIAALTNQADGDFEPDYADQCSSGKVAVAPGFQITSGAARPYGSTPSPTGVSGLGWKWGFVNADTPDIQLYLRCLTIRTGSTNSHVHKLYAKWLPDLAGDQDFIPVSNGYERRYSCNEKFYDKGMVASYWLDDHAFAWWLGMDPRPKTRAYRFWREAGGSGENHIGLLCIGTRTSGQLKP